MSIKFTSEDIKTFIWPAVGVLITLILLIAVIIPQIYSIIQTNLQIQNKKALSQDLQSKVEVLKNINVNQYKDDFNKLSVSLPASPDIPSAISQLEILAGKSKVTINAIGISIPSSTTSDNFQVRVDLEGDLGSINNFVSKLKTSSRLLVFNRVDMIGSKNTTAYQASITLVAYYQAGETTLSLIDQKIQPLSQNDLQEIANISKIVSQNPGVSETTTTGPKGKSNPFQ